MKDDEGGTEAGTVEERRVSKERRGEGEKGRRREGEKERGTNLNVGVGSEIPSSVPGVFEV